MKTVRLVGILTAITLLSACTSTNDATSNTADPTSAQSSESALVIADQGVFSTSGTVVESDGRFDPINGQMNPTGQTLHADHANVFFQIPENPNGHSMVFLHGYGQSRMGWQTTPDGRDGWADYFLRNGYSVYLEDQPRRGEAGNTSVAAEISTETQDQNWYTQFRMGLWPERYPGSAFPEGDAALEQFFRQMTPNTGDFDPELVAKETANIFDTSGPGVLVTHSQGGIPGWFAASMQDQVEGVVAIEPGGFVFPRGEAPQPINTGYAPVQGVEVSESEFDALIAKPIVIYFGDFIPEEADEVPALDFWRGVREMAHEFAEVANARGGDVTVVSLPDEGITGNTHFMFQDSNSDEVATHVQNWMTARNL